MPIKIAWCAGQGCGDLIGAALATLTAPRIDLDTFLGV